MESTLDKWEAVKKDLSHDREMSVWLKKAYPVVAFDHYQLELDFVRNLYKDSGVSRKESPKPEEIKRENHRKKIASYFETELKRVLLEIRFPVLRMELISRVKKHPAISELNSHSPASIRVIIEYMSVNQEGDSDE